MKIMVPPFMLEGLRPCTVLCFNVHATVEYLNKNVSIGQLLQHIPNSIVVCAGSGPKRQKTNHITKKFVSFYNHCLQLTMLERSKFQKYTSFDTIQLLTPECQSNAKDKKNDYCREHDTISSPLLLILNGPRLHISSN